MTRHEMMQHIASMIIMDEPSIDFGRAQALATAILAEIDLGRVSTHQVDEYEKE